MTDGDATELDPLGDALSAADRAVERIERAAMRSSTPTESAKLAVELRSIFRDLRERGSNWIGLQRRAKRWHEESLTHAPPETSDDAQPSYVVNLSISPCVSTWICGDEGEDAPPPLRNIDCVHVRRVLTRTQCMRSVDGQVCSAQDAGNVGEGWFDDSEGGSDRSSAADSPFLVHLGITRQSLVLSQHVRSDESSRTTWLAGIEAQTAAHRVKCSVRCVKGGTRALRNPVTESDLRKELARLLKRQAHPIGLPRERRSPHGWRKLCDKVERLADILDEGAEAVAAECWKRTRRAALWHYQRAAGHLQRFEGVDDCGTLKRVRVTCLRGCGDSVAMPMRCCVDRACAPCRAIRARERQKRFGISRLAHIERAQHAQLLGRPDSIGRWSEKFATFTVPHVVANDVDRGELTRALKKMRRGAECGDAPEFEDELDAVELRIKLIFAAWFRFRADLRGWFRKRYLRSVWPMFVLHRSFEWTRGADLLGHPHFHAYVFGPFIHWSIIQELWTDALRACGLRESAYPDPVRVEVKPIKTDPARIRFELLKGRGNALQIEGTSAKEVFEYTEKWCIDEAGSDGARIAPSIAGRVYAALESRRISQASVNFLQPLEKFCPSCGGIDTREVRIEDVPILEREAGLIAQPRGPPRAVASHTHSHA